MIRYLVLILILVSMSSAQAEDSEPDFSSLKRTSTDRVDTVIDGLTISMKSGKIIRLSSLNIPQFVFPEPGEISVQAKKELETLLKPGTQVHIYQTVKPKVGRENRMGHFLAHLESVEDGIWVQRYLLENGLARAAPMPRNFELTDQMIAYESKAQKAQKGLWADTLSPLLSHENAENALGNFAVVEGTIRSAASVKNKVYLNFGDNWRTDFTIMIEPPVRKLMARENIDPLALNGKHVRVRGWVEDYNGPLIKLNHPKSLEIITGPAAETLKSAEQPSMVSPNH